MGPRRIRRGERSLSPILLGRIGDLQWGHGEFAVENPRTPRTVCRSSASCNGATANSPWRTSRSTRAPAAMTSLQWGHGEFAVENQPATLGANWRGRPFNGATANSPWRTYY